MEPQQSSVINLAATCTSIDLSYVLDNFVVDLIGRFYVDGVRQEPAGRARCPLPERATHGGVHEHLGLAQAQAVAGRRRAAEAQPLKWFRSTYMIYDYCKDKNKFPNDVPAECSLS